jgi:hypothetical protein
MSWIYEKVVIEKLKEKDKILTFDNLNNLLNELPSRLVLTQNDEDDVFGLYNEKQYYFAFL